MTPVGFGVSSTCVVQIFSPGVDVSSSDVIPLICLALESRGDNGFSTKPRVVCMGSVDDIPLHRILGVPCGYRTSLHVLIVFFCQGAGEFLSVHLPRSKVS